MRSCRRLITITTVSVLSACGGGGGGGAPSGNSTPVPASGSPAPGSINPPATTPFIDATAASNISFVVSISLPPALQGQNIPSQIPHITFGGAAAGDCDSDGDVDLFITYGDGSNNPNRLYLNQLSEGNPLQFRDAAADAGVANSRADGAGNDRHSGPVFADLDGDGDLDIFMGGLFDDPNKVYRNRGDCRFDDVSASSGLEWLDVDHTISAALGDYDLDGDLDLFLTHWGSADEFSFGGATEHLFRNDSGNGEIRFVNVSGTSGISAALVAGRQYSTDFDNYDYTLTPSIARIDDDVWPDIAVAADFGTAQLLLNDRSAPGTFVDVSTDAVLSIQFGMGSALGDIDDDGDLDWFVTSIHADGLFEGIQPDGNRLLVNTGSEFLNTGMVTSDRQIEVADGGFGWGSCFADVDNDADLDLYHTNGWPWKIGDDFTNDRSRLFVRTSSGAFVDRARRFGLDDTASGRGVVCADFDNDGDIDILQLTNNQFNSAKFWENSRAAGGNNFLRVRLIGLAPNTGAAGARIFATVGSKTQMREIMVGSNYTSQNPMVQVFGLGTATSVDTLRVEWPARMPGPSQPGDRVETNIPAGAPGQTLVICHPELVPVPAACD